ncbi:hypothetical protein ACQ4PT_055001 [Festuca glaucescens]
MQPGRDSEGSHAHLVKLTTQGRRRAYNNAMNSKTVGLLGIHTTRPGSSQPAAATESQPAAAASPPVPVDESDEEENSYDQNDTMSEEYGFGDCHIEISDDGNSVDGGGASQRGKKRQKGMKVGPKVTVQPCGKPAEVSTAFSGSTYPTSNIFYPRIVNVKIALREACECTKPDLKTMGEAMMDKFNKYWEEPNNVMVIAIVFYSRYKLKYIKWGFYKIYGREKAAAEYDLIEIEVAKMYETYDMHHQHDKADSYRAGASSSTYMDTSASLPSSASEFTSYLSETSLETTKNELDKYLGEANESLLNKKFDMLLWWKLNVHRYPIAAKMAKNFLTIPATSVSSESTFSTGGRVLDDFRSSLKPSMVEALVCASSWIKGAHNDKKKSMNVVADDDDDVETIPFPKSVLGSNYKGHGKFFYCIEPSSRLASFVEQACRASSLHRKVKLWVGDSQEDGLDIPNTSLEEVGGATQEMRDRIERQYNEKYVVSENSQTDDEKEKSDSDTVVDNSKVFYNKNQVAVLEYIGNEKNKDNVVDENKHRMTRSTAVPSIPTASVSQTASVTVMEEDVEPDEVVPRLDDEDELMFPELVDRFSQHAMEDVYTEELSRPARFDDTNDEEKEENNDSLVAADYNGEDMPTIEWDREDPKLTPGTVFELMWDCRNALTTYCILTQNDFVIVKMPPEFGQDDQAGAANAEENEAMDVDEQNAEIEAMDDQIEANADGEAMDDQIEAKAEAMFETCLSLANNLALARGVEVFAIQPTAKR